MLLIAVTNIIKCFSGYRRRVRGIALDDALWSEIPAVGLHPTSEALGAAVVHVREVARGDPGGGP